MHSTTCLALMHSAHSTACTALHTQPILGGAPHLAGGGGKPKKGVAWICREEKAARKAHKVCIWCATAGHIGKDCPNEKIAEMALPSSHWAILADVALRGAPDAHLACLPGSNLLSADPRCPVLGSATPVRRGALHAQHLLNIACTALRQHC